MKVYCTHNFADNINKLSKNNSYKAAIEDVCDFLSNKNLAELHQMNDVITKSPGKFSLNKYRVINSLTNKGKSSSYRCITICKPEDDSIYLDTIYAKTGSLGTDNLTKETYKKITANVIKSISEGKLLEIDIFEKTIEPINPKGKQIP